MIHDAGVETVGSLAKRGRENKLPSAFNLSSSVLLFFGVWLYTYKNPEEEGDLERVLEEDEVDQVQDNLWPSEPEVFV